MAAINQIENQQKFKILLRKCYETESLNKMPYTPWKKSKTF